jgi:hypothetical protein
VGCGASRASFVEAVALPQHPCTPALEQLLAEWDAAGFEIPSKPGQMIVQGRNGRVSTAPEVTYMINQIRQAVWDCQHLFESDACISGRDVNRGGLP